MTSNSRCVRDSVNRRVGLALCEVGYGNGGFGDGFGLEMLTGLEMGMVLGFRDGDGRKTQHKNSHV